MPSKQARGVANRLHGVQPSFAPGRRLLSPPGRSRRSRTWWRVAGAGTCRRRDRCAKPVVRRWRAGTVCPSWTTARSTGPPHPGDSERRLRRHRRPPSRGNQFEVHRSSHDHLSSGQPTLPCPGRRPGRPLRHAPFLWRHPCRRPRPRSPTPFRLLGPERPSPLPLRRRSRSPRRLHGRRACRFLPRTRQKPRRLHHRLRRPPRQPLRQRRGAGGFSPGDGPRQG